MKEPLKSLFSNRSTAILLVILLVISAFNVALIVDHHSDTKDPSAVYYDFVVSQDGNRYQLKDMLTGSTKTFSGDLSLAIKSAMAEGNSVYLNPGRYELESDILISDKMNAKISGDGVTILGNGHKIVVYGDNYTVSEFAGISGFTLINGTIRIENSFGVTVSNIIFENTATGIELANTNTWSEDTKIGDCQFINATEGIAFRTPVGSNATGSYESSEIERCFFNIRDYSIGIKIEPKAEFSDCLIQDVRMWMGQDGHTNQTGLQVNGAMDQTLLFSTVFESFTAYPNYMFGIDIGQTCDPAPTIDSGVNFLGNWTAAIHNPYSKLLDAEGSSFERQNVNVPVGTNSQYGVNATIDVSSLRIFSFTPKIQVNGILASNETVTVRVRLEFIDNVISNGVIQTFNGTGSAWLSNDQMLALYPSQDIIVGVVFDAASNEVSTNAVVTVGGYGTTG